MKDFLFELALRKYLYYHYLPNEKYQLYKGIDGINLIQIKARNEELLEIIEYLPIEQQRIIDEIFAEMTGLF